MPPSTYDAWVARSRERARASGHAARPAEPADARQVAEVHVRVWRATYAGLMPAEHLAGMDVEASARRWRSLLESVGEGVRIQVGTDATGRVVGFASAGPTRDDDGPTPQELYAINVLPEAHGSGVAQLLMDGVVVPGACSLWVAVGNDRAEAFYRRHAFRDDGRTTTHPGSGVQEKRMVRRAPG